MEELKENLCWPKDVTREEGDTSHRFRVAEEDITLRSGSIEMEIEAGQVLVWSRTGQELPTAFDRPTFNANFNVVEA